MAGGDHVDPVDGCDVVTTLDLDLQDVADKALRRQLERQNALWGTTIVMEVRTGEVLAMVNLGRNADGTFAERENYALGRSMEPGSTFKLATMLTLLDDAGMRPSTVYDTHNGDPVTVGPAKNIRDSHRGDHEDRLPGAPWLSSSERLLCQGDPGTVTELRVRNRNTAISSTRNCIWARPSAGTPRRAETLDHDRLESPRPGRHAG